MERVYVYGGRINQGGPQDISGFGARQQVTRTRRIYVSNESRNELPTFDPFVTHRNFFEDDDYPSLFPTMETSMITGRRLYAYGSDSPSSPPSKVDSHMRTSGYYSNDSPSAFPPMVTQPYYGHESSAYPATQGPARGNPINLDVNFHMMPQEEYPPPGVPLSSSPAPYGGPRYGGPQVASPPPVWPQQPATANSVRPQQPATANNQFGGGKYNPQIQGGVRNKGGEVVMGPKMHDRNKFGID